MNIQLEKKKYNDHKHLCKGRKDALGNPIEFRLTFDEWINIWDMSGKWNLRGRKKGQYCMSRKNDIGHYEVGNVEIKLHSDNLRERFTRTENIF